MEDCSIPMDPIPEEAQLLTDLVVPNRIRLVRRRRCRKSARIVGAPSSKSLRGLRISQRVWRQFARHLEALVQNSLREFLKGFGACRLSWEELLHDDLLISPV